MSFFYLNHHIKELYDALPQRPARNQQKDGQQDLAKNNMLNFPMILPFRKAKNIQKKGSQDQKRRQDHRPRAKGEKAGMLPIIKGRHDHGKQIQRAGDQ